MHITDDIKIYLCHKYSSENIYMAVSNLLVSCQISNLTIKAGNLWS